MSALSVRALLFTDIEGSTALVGRLGDGYQRVLERHHAIIRTAVADRSGVEESRQGDSLFATFPSATAALDGALDAQRRIEREPWPPHCRVRVRMGLHVGEIAGSGAGLVGMSIHQAARIMSAAHGGQIVVSGEVLQQASALPDDVKTQSLGVYDLRDVGRIALHQVVHPDLQQDFPELRTRRAVAHNLPVPLTSLVGRDAEADAVSALLDDHRLVTLLGEGGCGKTRLGLRVAADALGRFIDGVWLVDLAPLLPGADVTPRVAEVLGVQAGLHEVVSALRHQEVLLVLDNCEHVVESVEGLLTSVLSSCPSVKVVATSRVPLDVPGEARCRVPPLDVPRPGADVAEAAATEAIQLFVARAELVRPGYRLGEGDLGAVIELCTRLEGLPLAIELAAARLRGMSLAELLAGIDDRFGVLIGGPRSAPERHHTLRKTMDWSFQLLDADEQAVLRHLAAFRGGCDLESASAVCGTDLSGGTLDVLISLVDKSFVTAVDRDDSTRYRLHEAIREYAEGSMSAGDLDVVRDRHARWFVALAARLAQGPAAGGEQRWIRRHDVDRDNFQAAAEWLLGREPRTALRLLIDIEPGTDLTTQWRWCDDGIRQVLPLAVDSPAADRAAALALLTWVDAEFGRPSAVAQCAEAAALLDEIDDPAVRCSVLMMVARCHADAANGDLDAAEVAAAIAAGDRAGGTYWPIMVRHFLSFRASAPIAESLTTDALRIAERLGLEFFGALMRTTLAVLAQFRGDGAAALALWRRTVTVLDDRVIYAEDNAGFYALAEGEHGELLLGLHLAEDFAVRLTSGPHEPAVVAALHVVIAHLRGLAGDVDGAEDALEIVDRTAELSFDFIGGLAVVTRSKLLRMRGHTGAAAATIRPMSDHVGFTGITDIPMRVLEELAAVALALGRRDDAADLLATARQARQDSHKPLSPACRPDLAVLESTVADLTGITLSNVDVRAVAAAMEPPSS